MRRCRDHGDIAKQCDVIRPMIERVIADQQPIGLAAELAELLLVDTAEYRAVVPGIATELAQRPCQFALADVEHSDLDAGVRVGGANQHPQTAP